jgi:glycine/D-amino acid oxidase-like deaminating enzyme/nitrite reductase/ring-hydroxylating ferredoxin subunit
MTNVKNIKDMVLRDGNCPSLWQDTVQEYSPAPVVSGIRYDIAIAGGGITGITLALELQQAGKKCIVLEAQSIGFGTTGGTTAHLNTLLDTPYTTIIKNFGKENARLVAGAARSAIQLVQSNINRYSIDCGFEAVPGFLFAETEAQRNELQKIHDACMDVGVDVEFTSTIPVPISFMKALKISRQAKFHPLRYLHALAEAFEAAGGHIVEGCRVVASESDAADHSMLNIDTSTGAYHANALVYATHIPTGMNILHMRCPAYRSYAMAVTLNDGAYPKGLAYDMYDPYHYYRTQDIDGKKYLIVGGEDHRTGEEPNTNASFLKLESHVRSHFNIKEIAFRWSSQYFEPVDGLPYIGHLPGHPKNVYVATGYGGNGMIYSNVAAIVLKSLILNEENEYAALFSPARLKLVAGFTEFVKHNADVVKQFVGKWFGREEIHEIAELAPGEGKVVKYGDHALALFKDMDGTIHAVSPACTHMKCSVAWNAAEQSWDCPCHGARYSVEGHVLTGPAVRDLEPVEVRAEMEEKK